MTKDGCEQAILVKRRTVRVSSGDALDVRAMSDRIVDESFLKSFGFSSGIVQGGDSMESARS